MHLVVVLLNLLLLFFLLLDGILGDGISNLDVGGLPGREISSGINSGGLCIKKCHSVVSIDSMVCPAFCCSQMSLFQFNYSYFQDIELIK